MILEGREIGGIVGLSEVILFDGHAPPRLVGGFFAAEGQKLHAGIVVIGDFRSFIARQHIVFICRHFPGFRGLFLVGDGGLIAQQVGGCAVYESIGEDF